MNYSGAIVPPNTAMRTFLTAFCLLLSVAASAAPAPYYRWQSIVDGTVICRQTSPGEGWQRLDDQPFRDLNCSMPAARVDRPSGYRVSVRSRGGEAAHSGVALVDAG